MYQQHVDRVDIRWLETARVGLQDWPRLERLLDMSERHCAARFRFGRDRQSFVAAHALLRGMLSSRVAMPPAEWRFDINPQGKPEARLPPGAPRLRVNLSHTRGLVAVALANGHDIGIDVEWHARSGLTLDIADRYFAPAEVAALHRMDSTQLHDGLFAFWTLKEAFNKAIGLGLSFPLDAFAFTLSPLSISFVPGAEVPGPWLFRRFAPTSSHAMALALRHPAPERVSIVARAADLGALLDSDQLSSGAAGPGRISRK